MNGDEEFFDAVTGSDFENSSGDFSEASQKAPGALRVDPSKSNGLGKVGERPPQENGVQKHRTALPAPMFTRSDFSIWGILKKCVGLELSKITMPIAFNEPLSFLQRITEYMEHVYLVRRASLQPQALERMQCVAAFAVSAVASQWERTGKPFNPLLGETYELTREDLGFRFISEQVSHHPPISAFHSEGLCQDFLFHGSIYPKLKFWGKSVEAEPRGTITLAPPTGCIQGATLSAISQAARTSTEVRTAPGPGHPPGWTKWLLCHGRISLSKDRVHRESAIPG
uniref:Oxysterol-binding protein n=1 Tax=Molossus molossus TaxID=27622 RepID=A0A7J8HHX2_MOLMO|nr:hypothetical protein HJG59_010919 [Molossus molossus]